jgi:hypothetical protein
VAQNTTHRRSAIDGRTTRNAGHVTSLCIRKRIEEPFGWMKTVAGGQKLRYIGLQRNRAWFLMSGGLQPHPDRRPRRSGGLIRRQKDLPAGRRGSPPPPRPGSLTRRATPQPFLASTG